MDIFLENLEFTTLQNLPEFFINEKVCQRVVSKNGNEIRYVPDKYITKDLFLSAVKNDGTSIKYCDEPDEEMCIAAINNNPESLMFIAMNFRTDNVCKAAYIKNPSSAIYFPMRLLSIELIEDAITLDGTLLQLLPQEKRTKKVCRLAVLNNGLAIKHVKNPNRGLCKIAVEKNSEALKSVPVDFVDKELCLKAVYKNGMNLKHVPKSVLDQEIIDTAILNDPNCIRYVSDEYKSEKICKIVIEYNGLLLKYLENKRLPEDYYYLAIRNNPLAFQYFPNRLKNYESCITIVKECGLCINFVPLELRNLRICEIALEKNKESFLYIPKSVMTRDLCFKACDEYFKHVNDAMKDEEICEKAVKSDGFNIQYVPKELINENLCKIAILQNGSCASLINDKILKKIVNELLKDIIDNPVLPKLDLISKIKKGDTISTTYQSVMEHSSWSATIWRTFSKDSRKVTVQWIRETFEEAKKYMISKELLRECISRLDNLKGTYEDDNSISVEIESIKKDFKY